MALRPALQTRPRLLELGKTASGTVSILEKDVSGSLGDGGTSASLDWALNKISSVPTSYELPSSPRLLLNLKPSWPLVASIPSN